MCVHDACGRRVAAAHYREEMADCACDNIQAALPEVEANRARGAKSHKLAKILTRKVAERYQLSVVA